MSSIQFLASSKPFNMPEEIEDYNNSGVYEIGMCFSVYETDKWWCDIVKPILSMPYIYEVGDVIELYEIPVQHWYEEYIQRVLENSEPITINVSSYTYQNQYGTYQLNPKKWVEELSHQTLLTERGVTTIVNY